MRIVADTHVVVSSLLWGGPPRAIFDAAREQRIALFTSAPLIAELDDVLRRAKLVRRLTAIGRTPDELLDRNLALARFVKLGTPGLAVSRDPDDDQIIATAVAARANLIVSGDLDLLVLGGYRAIPIVAAAAAVARIGTVRR